MDLVLEVPPGQQDKVWDQVQCLGTAATRFSAYTNQLSLLAVLPELEERWGMKASWINSCWEFVNGTAIDFESTRVVLIPSEAIEQTELRIPQEWIDIPSWAGDYYLAVQVNAEDGIVRVWGYATHREIKQQGNYDQSDRTYSLDGNLTQDMSVLWVIRQFCPDAATKTTVEPLPTLSVAQANELLEQLSHSCLFFAKRAVEFNLWGALLEKEEWRKRLLYSRSCQID
ncbi:DUF1822 family protein [Nostoc spongiaeforme FACHB-130]|uniref:DUF1822 family protein n=1 Tax=Nostoc spongiaeforme FACHB-130 TaxID=1357510 RepID=A0ABR8FZI8_9NOSO|nr:DUF1822 family protein [Nostoc spongiaeforme]MBD2596038.1 DUF1822 family protein [Nostoc spongiaeforme FACHB-130]